jgi:predicted DNA-binding protein with PD1-like motif
LCYCFKTLLGSMIYKAISLFISISIVVFSCTPINKAQPSMKVHAIRLKPGQDLRSALEAFVKDKNIEAGWIVTCVGSVTHYNIRFANQQHGSTGRGHFEIVSLVGTLSKNGSHLHLSISDSTGKTIGGHLLEGCTIYTTAEIVLQEGTHMIFTRQKDGSTPWEELQIKVKQ